MKRPLVDVVSDGLEGKSYKIRILAIIVAANIARLTGGFPYHRAKAI